MNALDVADAAIEEVEALMLPSAAEIDRPRQERHLGGLVRGSAAPIVAGAGLTAMGGDAAVGAPLPVGANAPPPEATDAPPPVGVDDAPQPMDDALPVGADAPALMPPDDAPPAGADALLPVAGADAPPVGTDATGEPAAGAAGSDAGVGDEAVEPTQAPMQVESVVADDGNGSDGTAGGNDSSHGAEMVE